MSGLANEVALVTGGLRAASAQRSPSAWPEMERTWPLRTRRTPRRFPTW